MSHPLDGARAKVKRAMQHIETLKRDITAFVHQQPYRALIEKDARAGTIRIIVKASGLSKPPLDFMLVAGEVAHQLRSALDHAVYALCSLRYHRPPKHKTQFPIFEALDGYESKRRSLIKDIPKAASTYIRSVQPYRSTVPRQHPLWILQDLNNTDKHRLIPILVTGAGAINFPETKLVKEHSVLFRPEVQPLEDGTELLVMPFDPSLPIEINPELACDVAFEQIGGTKLRPVIPLLKELSRFVDRIIYVLSLP